MLTIEYAKNPMWNSADEQQIYIEVKFAEFSEELPFNASAFDSEPHGVELYNRAKAGEFGKIAPFVPPEEATQPTVEGAQTL